VADLGLVRPHVVMRHDNTFPVFCYSAAAILGVVALMLVPIWRDFRNYSLSYRAVFLVFAGNLLIWSGLGFTLLFYSVHFSTHIRAALFNLKWVSSGITLGLMISLLFIRFFDGRGLTKR
jgi:hypothetical protein